MNLYRAKGISYVIHHLKSKWLTNFLFILLISFFVASGIFVYFFLEGLKKLSFSMSIDGTHSVNRAIYTSIPDVSPEKSFIKEIEERISFFSKEYFGDAVTTPFWYHESGKFHLNPTQEMKNIPIITITSENTMNKEDTLVASVRSSWKFEDFLEITEGKMPAIEIDLLKALSVEKRDEREAARSGKPWWEVSTYERHVVIETIVPKNKSHPTRGTSPSWAAKAIGTPQANAIPSMN